ncbi:MAG: hypothetical protein ACLT98_15615 [Eggerthellaceae bacterium]
MTGFGRHAWASWSAAASSLTHPISTTRSRMCVNGEAPFAARAPWNAPCAGIRATADWRLRELPVRQHRGLNLICS